MAKSIFYRWFGWGKLPTDRRAEFQEEGIILEDEGLSSSAIFTKFKNPSRYYGKRFAWMLGSVVLTEKRLVAHTMYTWLNELLSFSLDDPKLKHLQCGQRGDETFVIFLEMAHFKPDWGGTIEFRFGTDKARKFLNKIIECGATQIKE